LARKILLADDSVTAQNMGRRILTDAGYEVTTVNNGSAALKRIAESKPDLIVLDVYMPGYGGLEVCQRLREAPETARIPVLLTVGKLEPFKAEDARRVRADAFIVKPFEASELLTALAKLEDKIVPQSQPPKSGRFAKAMAAADDAASAKEYGDSETGWKNRLSIPPPHAKPREVAPEAVEVVCTPAASSEGQKPVEMKSGVEEALMATLPPDVTQEEIAAIRAAAAAFNTPSDETVQPVEDKASIVSSERVAEPEAAKAEEQPAVVERVEETHAVTFAAAPDTHVETSAAVSSVAIQPESASTAEEKSGIEAAAPAVEAVAEATPILAPEAPREVAVSVSEAKTKPTDDEVTAALATLAPSHGNGDGAARNSDAAPADMVARNRAMVTLAAEGPRGPRWVAEAVALADDDSTVALEYEMQRAYAGFAAADAARMGSSGIEGGPPSNVVVSESKSEEPVPQAVAATPEPEPAAVAAVSENSAPEGNFAFAAVASVGADTQLAIVADAVSQPVAVPEVSESAPTEGNAQGDGELAAAWANWRQVRETVLAAHVAGSGSGGAKSVQQTETQAETSSDGAEESSDIANIVDSVLADLKPKLMEEISRKMGKGSKKK